MAGNQPGRQRTEPTAKTEPLTEDEEERYKLARLRAVGLAIEFGFTTFGALGLCLWGGIWLDRRFGTSPLFLLTGLVLAFMAIGYNLYQLATVRTGPRRPRKPTAGTSEQARRPARNWDDWDEDKKDPDDDWPVRRRTGG
jgi:F0F1-type ATP synthase assembly protein I